MEAGAVAEQGSAAWFQARIGFVTASRFKDVLDFTAKGAPGSKRKAYLMEVVLERLTGAPQEHFASVAMQHGTDQEPMARMAYEAATGEIVEEVGFIRHPTLEGVGGSPDGLVGDSGGFEAKCPFNSANHIYTLLEGMPAEHMAQVQGLMWITGREWWDFASYDPRLPAPLDLYRSRVPRSETYIADLERAVIAFLAEVAEMVKRLQALSSAPSPATTSDPASLGIPLEASGAEQRP